MELKQMDDKQKTDLEQGRRAYAHVMTHEQMLAQSGFDICSPISGSMRPLIRPQRDSALFVAYKGRLKKYDVALYRRDGQAIMHRVLRVLPNGYIIRGDNANISEYVANEQVIGVMKGFYRDEWYVSCDHMIYWLYAIVWPKLHPILMLYKRMRRFLYSAKRRFGRILR